MYDSIRHVDVRDWALAGANGLLMAPRFLLVAEETMSDDLRIWHVIFRDGSQPIACASFGLYRADLAVLASPRTRHLLNRVRSAVPKFAYVNVLFCGLPISIGLKSIGFSTGCDNLRLVKTLDTLMTELAQKNRAHVLVAKEFTASECDMLDPLLRYRFFRASTPNQYIMMRQHASFSEYFGALKSHYRHEVKRSLKKFADSGIQVERLLQGDCIASRYTDELHSLYEAVVEKAEHRLEILPASFFRSLALAFPENVSLTLFNRMERTVAFGYAIRFEDCYYLLFSGMDYEFSRSADIYFNMFYQEMENWLRDGVPRVQMGQASDEFKTRLGCSAVPLFCYVKVTGVMRPIVMANIHSLFPPPTAWQPRDIYKAGPSRE